MFRALIPFISRRERLFFGPLFFELGIIAACLNWSLPLRAGEIVQPYLTLGANRQTHADVFRGWPILFILEILRSDSFGKIADTNALQLLPEVSGWNGSIRLNVKAADDSIVSWPAHLVGDIREPVSIQWREAAEFGWWVEPQDSKVLPVGEYQIYAELNTLISPGGWIGKTNSPPVFIRLADEPTPLPPELLAEKLLRLAYYNFWTGKTNEAVSLDDDLLASQPNSIAALSMQGDLASTSGKWEEALAAYDQALEQFDLLNPDTQEMPIELIQKRHAALLKVLLGTSGQRPTLSVKLVGNEVLLEWDVAANQTYRLENSSDLKTWTVLKEGIEATAIRVQAKVPIRGSSQFFRVVQL